MQINISGHHVDVTDAIKDYIEGKMNKLIRHFDQITSINVIVSVEKLVQKSEATIHVSGNDMFADAEHEDLYTAIDQMTEKLDRQLIKHKEKLRSHR